MPHDDAPGHRVDPGGPGVGRGSEPRSNLVVVPAKSSKWISGSNKYLTIGTKLLEVLERDDVKPHVQAASDGLISWAQTRRKEHAASGRKLDPLGAVTSRVGHQRLERRLDELFAVVSEFDAVRPELAEELRTTEADLRRAVTVTAQLSATNRLRARRDIYKRLDVIEERLVEAILPDDSSPSDPMPG